MAETRDVRWKSWWTGYVYLVESGLGFPVVSQFEISSACERS